MDEAVSTIKSGDRIAISAGSSTLINLVNALAKRYKELENVTIFSGLLMYPFEHLKSEYKGHINHHSIFVGPLERMFMPFGNIEATSYHFSETDWLSLNIGKTNILMCECSPPDKFGYMIFGPLGAFNNDIVTKYADTIIVQVNNRTPYVLGMQNFIHISDVNYICEKDHELLEIPDIPIAEEERGIASYIVDRIPDVQRYK